MEFPYLHFEKNLVIDRRREAWAVYQVEPWHYEHLSQEARIGLLWRLSRLFWNLEEHAAQLLIVPHSQRVRERLEGLSESLKGPLAEAGQAYCAQAADAVARSFGEEATEYAFFLALHVPPPQEMATTPWSFLRSLVLEPKRLMEETAGVAEPRLLSYELENYLQREELLWQRLSRLVRVARLKEEHLAWLVRRSFFRGIGDPPGRPNWTPDVLAMDEGKGQVRFLPSRADLVSLAEGEMDLRNPRHIAVTQIQGDAERTGYTTFAYVADLPDEMTFPGCEWLYSLQDLRFPVEVCLRWENLNYRSALAVVRRKQLEINDQDMHTRRSGEAVPLGLVDAQEQAAVLEQDLKQRRFPTALATVCLAVSGPTAVESRERMRRVRDHLLAHQITLEVPAGDQMKAFIECLPGTPRQVPDYVHRVPPEVLAGSMFLAASGLGDASGPYVGHTGVLGRPVYIDPGLPPKVNRSGSMAFIGSLGGGKSFAANLFTYLAVITGGGRALILDPKGERGRWPQLLPELGDQVRVITLGSRPEDAGKLDPFVVGKGLGPEAQAETGNLAVSLLSFLTGAHTGEARFAAIMRAVEETLQGPNPSMTTVMEVLAQMGESDPEAAALAEYLRALSHRAYASLLFGTGTETGPDLSHPVTVLQLQDLTMPPPERPASEYSLEELLSVGLMHAVTVFATHFTLADPRIFKIVLMDEAWTLTASPQGRALVARLLRTGRSHNSALYLVTQNVADLLDETIKNNLGPTLIFRSSDETEIGRGLALLNLDASAENTMTLRNLETGQALFQDLGGRTGVLTVDAVLPHLARAFDTRPPLGDD